MATKPYLKLASLTFLSHLTNSDTMTAFLAEKQNQPISFVRHDW